MAGFSNVIEQRVIEAIFKGTTFALPAQLHVSLHSADPGDTGASELVAGSSPGYTRAQRNPDPNNATNTSWNAINQAGAASAMTNFAPVTFPQATGNWNGGSLITFIGIWDAASAGNFICGGAISGGGVVVNNTQVLTFDGGSPGQLSVTLD